VAALLSRVRIEGPVYLIGGGAQLVTFVKAFQDLAGGIVRVAAEPQIFEALGAAVLAADQYRGRNSRNCPPTLND